MTRNVQVDYTESYPAIHPFGTSDRSAPSQDWRKLFEGSKPSPLPEYTQSAHPITKQAGHDRWVNPSSHPESMPSRKPIITKSLISFIQLLSLRRSLRVLLIDQEAAHQRILYEQYLEQIQSHPTPSQNRSFPPPCR